MSTEQWTYTADGRPATVTDGNDNVTTYTYDDFDRLVRTTYPDTTYEELTLDDAGRVTAVLTRGSQTISLGYDDLDRLTSRTIPDHGSETFTYDLVDRILTAAGPDRDHHQDLRHGRPHRHGDLPRLKGGRVRVRQRLEHHPANLAGFHLRGLHL